MNSSIIHQLINFDSGLLGDGAPVQLSARIIEKLFGASGITLKVPIVPKMGHMTNCELALLVGIIQASGCKHFFEIGTFDGLTVCNVLNNCSDIESVTTVDLPLCLQQLKGAGTKYQIDPPNQSLLGTVKVGDLFAKHPRKGIVRQILKDSALLTESDIHPKPDCCFIDGCHTYDYCKNDTLFSISSMQKPGIIFIHDYGKLAFLPGVSRYVIELASSKDYPLFRLGSGDGFTSLILAVIQ